MYLYVCILKKKKKNRRYVITIIQQVYTQRKALFHRINTTELYESLKRNKFKLLITFGSSTIGIYCIYQGQSFVYVYTSTYGAIKTTDLHFE